MTGPTLVADDARVAPALDSPCGPCPWRTANHGRRSAKVTGVEVGGWYTKANLRRLWAGLRRGEMMVCHPTDPRHPTLPGKRPTPANTTPRECAGAHLLLQRELDIAQRLMKAHPGENAVRLYRRLRPGGLTRDGLAAYMHRVVFGGVPLVGGCQKTPRPNLHEPCSVGTAALPWPIRLEGEPHA